MSSYLSRDSALELNNEGCIHLPGSFVFGYLLILFYLGAVVVGHCLGRWILLRFSPDQAERSMVVILVGLVGVWLLTAIPFLGAIAGLFIVLFGVGGLWLAGRERLAAS